MRLPPTRSCARWLVTIAAGLALAFAGPATLRAVTTAPRAPAFTLKDLDGREVKLADFAGHPLLVLFWASWDKPSGRQLPILVELQKRHAAAGLEVLAISLDAAPPAKIREFAKQNGLNFAVLLYDLKVIQDFGGIEGIPTTFLIDRNHNLIRRFVGVTEAADFETELKAVLEQK